MYELAAPPMEAFAIVADALLFSVACLFTYTGAHVQLKYGRMPRSSRVVPFLWNDLLVRIGRAATP